MRENRKVVNNDATICESNCLEKSAPGFQDEKKLHERTVSISKKNFSFMTLPYHNVTRVKMEKPLTNETVPYLKVE